MKTVSTCPVTGSSVQVNTFLPPLVAPVPVATDEYYHPVDSVDKVKNMVVVFRPSKLGRLVDMLPCHPVTAWIKDRYGEQACS